MGEATADSSLEDLKQLIRTIPLIDNHAHNLLRPHGQKHGELLTLTSEAEGDALEDTPTTLAHLRAVKQLRKLYDLPSTADWDAILKKRKELLQDNADDLIRKCFEGTQTLLIDDGLADQDKVEPYHWHDSYTRSPCKRIVRIEALATEIISSLYQQNKLPTGAAVADEEACSLGWVSFIAGFEHAIIAAIEDPEVIGFKSVICYRTGLDVQVGRDLDVTEDGLRSFRRHFLPECVARNFRVEAKGMNDALVISCCKLIAAGYRQHDFAKPLQFHTGLGDNDISLRESNPAYLQPLIKAFPTVPIVLLHSSYPYTRQAGYLATVYRNCYLDIGEVFPMVSRDGQEKIVRQSLELTPWSKLLWSTDGHYYPETFWLANVQGREVIEKVICDYVEQEDFTVAQAIHAVNDLFFENSNRLYGLRLKLDATSPPLPERPKAIQAADDIHNSSAQTAATRSMAATSTADQPDAKTSSVYNINGGFIPFKERFPGTQFVFVQWLDFLGQMRSRCTTISEFTRLVQSGQRITISHGNLGTLQNDFMTSECEPVGSLYVEPDLDLVSLRPMQNLGPLQNSATVMARFVDESGVPLDFCPRSTLQYWTSKFEKEHEVQFLVGFEIEVVFARRNPSGSEETFTPLDTSHAWGTFLDEQYIKSFPLMTDIMAALISIGIDVPQMHSESGPGQYEFVLTPRPPAQAVDALVQARQCIAQIAAAKGLRATCYPTAFPGAGSGSHSHISFNSASLPSDELEKLQMSFMASILAHLPSICVFTLPQADSYGRVVDNSWTGGSFIAWGTQNRETPIRRSAPNRWEVRCLDGCANMYLALAVIFGIGYLGVRDEMEMKLKDCPKNPTKLSDEERQALGITGKMPKSLTEAIEAAENDSELEQALKPGVVKHFLTVKKQEQEMLSNMPEKERKVWLMERY